MKVLVTGAAGFIDSAVYERLLARVSNWSVLTTSMVITTQISNRQDCSV